MRKTWLGFVGFAVVLSLSSLAAWGYESATLGSFTSTAGAVACVALPTNLPAQAKLAATCRGAPCHYRAQVRGGTTVTQHDALLAQDGLFDIPVDGGIGTVCFVGDASATVTGDVYRVLP